MGNKDMKELLSVLEHGVYRMEAAIELLQTIQIAMGGEEYSRALYYVGDNLQRDAEEMHSVLEQISIMM